MSQELDTKSIQLVVSTDRTSLIESAQDNESTGVVVQLILDTATFPVNVLSPSFGIVLSVAKLCNAGVFGLRWASNGRFIVSVLDPLPAVDFGDPPSLVGFSRRDRLKWQALSREVDVALPLTAVSVGDGAPSLQKLQTLAEVKISQEDLANQPQGLALTLRPYQVRRACRIWGCKCAHLLLIVVTPHSAAPCPGCRDVRIELKQNFTWTGTHYGLRLIV